MFFLSLISIGNVLLHYPTPVIHWFPWLAAPPLHHFPLSLLDLDPQTHIFCAIFNRVPTPQLSLSLDPLRDLINVPSDFHTKTPPSPISSASFYVSKRAPGSKSKGCSQRNPLKHTNAVFYLGSDWTISRRLSKCLRRGSDLSCPHIPKRIQANWEHHHHRLLPSSCWYSEDSWSAAFVPLSTTCSWGLTQCF